MKKKKKVENSEVVMPNDFSDFLIGVGFSIDSQSSIEKESPSKIESGIPFLFPCGNQLRSAKFIF